MQYYPFYGSKEAWAAKCKEMRNARLERLGLERKYSWSGKSRKKVMGEGAYRKKVMEAIVRSMAPGVEDPAKVFREVLVAEIERLQAKLAGPIKPRMTIRGKYDRR